MADETQAQPRTRRQRPAKPPEWLSEHSHAHDAGDVEHTHHPDQTDDEKDKQHEALTFDAGPEANRNMDDDRVGSIPSKDGPEVDGFGESDGLTRSGNAARSSTKDDDPQIGFGDDVINVEEEDGAALLKLFEVRQEHRAAASTFKKASDDIKEHLKRLGKYTGKAVTLKIGNHTFNLTDLANDKDIDAFTRHGAQRSSITHPG